MSFVYLLWREAWDYDESSEVESVHASIEGAARAHLDVAHPLAGPRGGKRPARPVVSWASASADPGYWNPDDGSHYGIERREVQV